MGKWVANEVLDAALQVIAGATHMVAVTGQPESYTAAMATCLAEAAVVAGDFSLLAGSGFGRKLQISGKTGLTVLAAGLANHVALVDRLGERLLYVTTCPEQNLLAGAELRFEPWSVEVGAPI